jgi:hypothetical protein
VPAGKYRGVCSCLTFDRGHERDIDVPSRTHRKRGRFPRRREGVINKENRSAEIFEQDAEKNEN